MSGDNKKPLNDLTLVDTPSTSSLSRTVKKNISIKFKKKQTESPQEQPVLEVPEPRPNEAVTTAVTQTPNTKPVVSDAECKTEGSLEKSRKSPSTSTQSSSSSSDESDDKRVRSKSDSRSSRSDSQSSRRASSRHKSHNLSWDYGFNLIGVKSNTEGEIFICEECNYPILTYGRLMRCRHVFCLDCAKKSNKNCPKCDEPVQRVENIKQGPLFICVYGANHRQDKRACRKSYLTEHDLFSHMRHRHRCSDKDLADNYLMAFFSSDYMSMPMPPDFRLLGYCPTPMCPSLMDTQRFMSRAPMIPANYGANVTAGPPMGPFAIAPNFQNVQLPFVQQPPPQFTLPIPHLRY